MILHACSTLIANAPLTAHACTRFSRVHVSLPRTTRWNDGNCCSTADWRMCDRLHIVPVDCAKISGPLSAGEMYVTSIEHNHGRDSAGRYAHFKLAFVDAIAGRTSWSNQNFKLVNRRTGKSGTAVIWRGPNRQIKDSTEGHLRWSDGNCCSTADWRMCDRLHIVPV